ncbi:MAG: transposase [Chthoniobacterales bacterium]
MTAFLKAMLVMRQARILLHRRGETPAESLDYERDGYYHCISRVIEQRFIFGEEEKTYFYHLMRRLERFTGLEIVTYCLMSNHFHLLLRVPAPGRITPLSLPELEAELRILHCVPPGGTSLALQEIERARASGSSTWEKEILARHEARRGDLSSFMKELKQRFSVWYNQRIGRRGPLWEDRFKSVLIEGMDEALMTVAAYIELNPVRAGLVEDPKDYRWCGYAEAVVGRKLAQRGLCRLLDQTSYGINRKVNWRGVSRRYRQLLFEHGEESERYRGISRKRVDEVIASGGKLSIPEILRCRVRYFCDGAILGRKVFVEKIFKTNRWRYSPTRKNGACEMRGAEWGDLRTLRNLRTKTIF